MVPTTLTGVEKDLDPSHVGREGAQYRNLELFLCGSTSFQIPFFVLTL